MTGFFKERLSPRGRLRLTKSLNFNVFIFHDGVNQDVARECRQRSQGEEPDRSRHEPRRAQAAATFCRLSDRLAARTTIARSTRHPGRRSGMLNRMESPSVIGC